LAKIQFLTRNLLKLPYEINDNGFWEELRAIGETFRRKYDKCVSNAQANL